MSRKEVSDSIAAMIIEENVEVTTSPVDFYNYWAQKTQTRIHDPNVAAWALNLARDLIGMDRDFLTKFLADGKM